MSEAHLKLATPSSIWDADVVFIDEVSRRP